MTTILILILIILLILVGCFIYLKIKVENFSKKWFGTKDFFEGINKQRLQIEETPKNPYGIDNLVMPEIEKDFPNLNIHNMKKIAENNIILCMNSVENKQIESFENISEKLINNLKGIIEDVEKYDDFKINSIKIHKTVINKYEKEESKCRIMFQTALGYKVTKNGETKKYEERINTEYVYIYNYRKIESYENISLKCPNCGAPIQSLGVKICPYCNAGIIDLAAKTWMLNDIVCV